MAETDLKDYLSDLATAISVEAALSAPSKPDEAQSQPAPKAQESAQNVDVKDLEVKTEPAGEPTSLTPVAPVPAKTSPPDLGASESSSAGESKGFDEKSKALPQPPEEPARETNGETGYSRNPKRSSRTTSGEITINFTVTPSMMSSPPPSRTRTEEEEDGASAPEPVEKEVVELASPAPVVLQQVPSAPQRPARPLSLRLSSVPQKSGLTTSRVVVVDPDKQYTSDAYMTQPHTGYITAAPLGSRIKYGRGKHATTELVPQPSDDAQDPLNWQTWRKELNFYALLMTAAMCNVMKTALVSVNSVLASNLGVSYVAVAALTGVPLMLSACAGLASSVAARIWGRRPVYLASMVLLFIGLVWNAKVANSYGQFMFARILQGFGWGAFDTLVVGSIMDTYFEHERYMKIAIYRIVSVATTWGSPLTGGVVAMNAIGVDLQFEILAVFQVVSIPLLVLGSPETTYDRAGASRLLEKWPSSSGPQTGWASLGLKSSSLYARLPGWARGRGPALDRAVQYVKEVAPPRSYQHHPNGPAGGLVVDRALVLQALRAAAAPTTVLAFLASFLPFSLLWGFSASLSGLFAAAPYGLDPATVGSLLATPFILATFATATFALWPDWSKNNASSGTGGAGGAFRVRSSHLLVLGGGAALSFVGVLGFALYVYSRVSADDAADQGIRFSALSFILGLLAAGAVVLDAPAAPLVHRSAQFTAPNLLVYMRSVADMGAGVTFWRTLFAGIFAMGIPSAVVGTAAAEGLKSTGAGVAVVQVFVVVGLGVVWYRWDERVRRYDGKILQCVDWSASSRGSLQSYFEIDD